MRILGLHADGFGILHDVSVANIPAGLAVFLGDNEAGKTTCLSFVEIFFSASGTAVRKRTTMFPSPEASTAVD